MPATPPARGGRRRVALRPPPPLRNARARRRARALRRLRTRFRPQRGEPLVADQHLRRGRRGWRGGGVRARPQLEQRRSLFRFARRGRATRRGGATSRLCARRPEAQQGTYEKVRRANGVRRQLRRTVESVRARRTCWRKVADRRWPRNGGRRLDPWGWSGTPGRLGGNGRNVRECRLVRRSGRGGVGLARTRGVDLRCKEELGRRWLFGWRARARRARIADGQEGRRDSARGQRAARTRPDVGGAACSSAGNRAGLPKELSDDLEWLAQGARVEAPPDPVDEPAQVVTDAAEFQAARALLQLDRPPNQAFRGAAGEGAGGERSLPLQNAGSEIGNELPPLRRGGAVLASRMSHACWLAHPTAKLGTWAAREWAKLRACREISKRSLITRRSPR